MLDHVEAIFDDMTIMMKKLKKPTYKKNMDEFCKNHGHFFCEMVEYVEKEDNHEEASKKIAEIFTDRVYKCFSKKGKIKGCTQADLNFFMIYYVFPAILMKKSEYVDLVAEGICKEWGTKFKDSSIRYADYDKIYNSFRGKIFGIF